MHPYQNVQFVSGNYTTILDKARMTKFIKAELKKSVDQTNINKYKVAAIITEYQIILNHNYLNGHTYVFFTFI